MAASKEDISTWFDAGVARGATHMLVICDQFDWDDYPVYVENGADARKTSEHHNGQNLQRVMECYDLRRDKGGSTKGNASVSL